MPKLRSLYLPGALLLAGLLAGHFVWPRQRGLTEEEKVRVDAAWSAAVEETGLSEKELTKRPANAALGKMWDFLQRLERAKEDEFPGIWSELATGVKTEKGVTTPELQLLVERWAELAPEEVHAFLAKKSGTSRLTALVFRVWARTNAETAIAAIAAESDPARREAAAGGGVMAVAEEPERLIAWARSLSWLDTAKYKEHQFDMLVSPECLRRAFELDPERCRELAAGLPPWFSRKLEALAVASEAVKDMPAALARIDAAGLAKDTATAFFLNMAPLGDVSPDKLLTVTEHLTEKLGSGWLKFNFDSDPALLETMAKAAPERIHAILKAAVQPSESSNAALTDAAVKIMGSDPRLALQMAPADRAWFVEFSNGPLNLLPLPGGPEETLELVKTAPGSALRNALLQNALHTLMQTGPDKAAAWVDTLPAGELQNIADVLLGLEAPEASPLAADLELAGAKAATEELDAAGFRRLQEMVERNASQDLEGTARQVAEWQDSAARDAALAATGKAWAERSTSEALAWADTLPDGARPQAVSGILQAWTLNEPGAAEQFIATLPESPERDTMLDAFISSFRELDPAAALAWATTIQDESLRRTVLSETAGEWLKSHPEQALETLKAMPGLTTAERQELLNAAH